ncbi:hypothetical protein HJC23_009723 [Cyclotella cryptica]|uniref:Uncharacterized protein n=1 Tax=Cyclotella cryptica TaxID=29204 RepID=A0ABD3NPE7_9STRA
MCARCVVTAYGIGGFSATIGSHGERYIWLLHRHFLPRQTVLILLPPPPFHHGTDRLTPPAILAFSLHFPFVIPYVSSAALSTYIPPSLPTTAVRSMWLLLSSSSTNPSSKRLQYYSAALLVCYALLTLVGGYAHQTVVGVDITQSLTSVSVLWIVLHGDIPSWNGLSPQTELGSPPCTVLLTTIGSGGYILRLLTTIGNRGYILRAYRQLSKLSPQTELTLPPCTDVLPTTIASGGYILRTEFGILLCTAVANNNWQGGYIKRGQAWEQPKLSPQTEFGIPPCTTV